MDVSVAPPIPIPEAASRLSISRTKAFELVASGAIRTIRIGERRFVPASEVDRVAEEGTHD